MAIMLHDDDGDGNDDKNGDHYYEGNDIGDVDDDGDCDDDKDGDHQYDGDDISDVDDDV